MARSWYSRAAPAILLMLLAPLLTEVLPGATRFSAIFVLPVEIAVWGGGAVLIREMARRKGLGWQSLLLLALALAIAEECLIQQTSLAPLVIKLKGVEYARWMGVNYVYLLWALAYESVLVVMLPVLLTELLFPARRSEGWLSKTGGVIVSLFFALGCFLAWFSWTQFARVNVFHLPPYTPPLVAVLIAIGMMAGLALLAVGPRRKAFAPARPKRPPSPWLVAPGGIVWSVLLYGMVLLAFGIAPQVPPIVPVGGWIIMVAAVLGVLPHWTAHADWRPAHRYALVFGVVGGAMAVSFVGFIWAAPADLWFKIVTNAIAVALLVWLGLSLRRSASAPHRS
ncbi:MAG: hypothetical protein ABIS51_21840 [Sphingomonas sp.]